MGDSNHTQACDDNALSAAFEANKAGIRRKWGDKDADGQITYAEVAQEIAAAPDGALARLLRSEATAPIQLWQISETVTREIASEDFQKDMPPHLLVVPASVTQEQVAGAIEASIGYRLNAAKVIALCDLESSAETIAGTMLENSFDINVVDRTSMIAMKKRDLQGLAAIDSVQVDAQVLYQHLLTDEEKQQIADKANVMIEDIKSNLENRPKPKNQSAQPVII